MASNLLRLGNKCNAACLFCTVAKDNERELSSKEAKKAIRLIANRNRTISFTGGEPTTRHDLVQLVEYAKKTGIETIELQSNALLLDKETVQKLKNAGLSHALIALHSHKRSVSERLLGKKNTFNKALRGIKNLLDAGVPTTISHVINGLNYKQLVEFTEFVRAHFPSINCIYFSFVRPNGRCAENQWLVPKLMEAEPELDKLFKHCQRNRVPFEVEGVPLCYMIGFEEHNVESRRLLEDPVVYIGSNETRENVHKKGLVRTKAKGNQCKLCYLKQLCCGVWKEYAQLHGTLELFPQYTDAKGIEAKIRGCRQ